VAAIAVFLARRPFKLVATDVVRRRWLPRSTIALGFTGLYGVVALTGLLGALVTAGSRFLIAYVAATPFALVALYADSQSKSRTLAAELAGATAMGSTATAIALAGGWGAADAFGLWLVLIARGVATISLVRGQIRRVHGKRVGERGIYTVALATLAGIAVAAALGVVPRLSVVAILGIAVLAYVSLRRPPVAAKTVGWTQIVTGTGCCAADCLRSMAGISNQTSERDTRCGAGIRGTAATGCTAFPESTTRGRQSSPRARRWSCGCDSGSDCTRRRPFRGGAAPRCTARSCLPVVCGVPASRSSCGRQRARGE
jgi:hypothetical protein